MLASRTSMETLPKFHYNFSAIIIHITLIHAKQFLINLNTYDSI